MTFEPGRGGNCIEFTNTINGKRFGSDNPDYRYFGGDRVDKLNYRTTMNLPFQATLLKETPEMVQLALSRNDFPGDPYLAFSKIYTIRRDSAVVDVEYRYINRPQAMAERVLAPHFRQAFFVNDGETTCTIPEIAGPKQYTTGGNKDLFVENVTRPFAGCADSKGNGMAVEFDLRLLDQLYVWRGGVNRSTLELFFRQVNIPAGKEFKMTTSVFPFAGLTEVSGAGNGIAAQVTTAAVRLASAIKFAGLLEVEATWPDRAATIFSRLVLLDVGSVVSYPLDGAALSGAKSLRVTLKRNNELFFKADKPLSPDYKLSVEVDKIVAAALPQRGYKPEMTVATPHVPWAKEYHGGKISALFITGSEHSRELVELAQRMDIDVATAWISLSSSEMKWGRAAMFGAYTYDDANQEIAEQLAARKYDVIVMSSGLPKYLNRKNLGTIAGLLKSGVGVLMVAPESVPAEISDLIRLKIAKGEDDFSSWKIQNPGHPIVAGVSPELLQPGLRSRAQLLGGEAILADETGAPLLMADGRKVLMNVGSRGGLLPFLPLKYDQPEYDYYEFQFVPLIKSLLHAAGKLSPTSAKVTLTAEELSFGGGDQLLVTVTNLTSNRREEFTMAAGEKRKIAFGPGMNAVGYIVKKQGKTVDFGTLTKNVHPTCAIRNLTVDQEVYQENDTIRGQVSVEGAPEQIVVRLYDSFGRELANATAVKEFAIQIPEVSSRRMYVVAELYQGKQLQSRRRIAIAVMATDRSMAAYEIITSGDSCELRNNRAFYRDRMAKLRENFGVNVIRFWNVKRQASYNEHLEYGFGMDFPMMRGQRLVDFYKKFSEPYAKTGDKKYLHREPCFHNKKHYEKVMADMKERFQRLEKFSPVSYDFDDESSLSKWGDAYDFCFAPATLQAFRTELQKRYGTLDKLNAEWGTAFANWQDVEPMTTPEMRQKQRQSRNYAAWAEFRDFMDETYAAWHGEVSREARKCGITVPFDISGTSAGNAYNGLQWYRWAPFIDQASLYHGANQEELMRSFAKPGFRATPWFGYDQVGKNVAYQIWHDALLFRRGGASYYSTRSIMRPDYTMDRPAREFREATMDLRSGVGELLNMAADDPVDVLIHFSQASIFAAEAEERLPEFFGIRNGWVKLLNDSGLTFKFVAYADIEKGILERYHNRTLVLPDSIAISAAEAQAIRRFVQSGGRVIASGNVAIMNEKCRLLPAGQLDELFVRHPDRAFRVENPGNYVFATRTAAARRKLAPCLPQPTFKIRGEFAGCRLFPGHFENGDQLIGVVRESELRGNSQVELALPEKRYWYDVRSSRFLGQADHIKVALQPGDAAVYAALKAPLPAPKITAATVDKVVNYEVILPGSKNSTVFKVEILGPDGKPRFWYDRLLPATAGKARGAFRPALNDPPGRWKIRCTDRISGQVGEAEVVIGE